MNPVVTWPVSFQSTPAITGERAELAGGGARAPGRFNPRPPLLASKPCVAARTSVPSRFQSTPAITGERAPIDANVIHGLPVFQSTPAITGERASLSMVGLPAMILFQSTPAITGERALRGCTDIRTIQVSIHARHYWRASPY